MMYHAFSRARLLVTAVVAVVLILGWLTPTSSNAESTGLMGGSIQSGGNGVGATISVYDVGDELVETTQSDPVDGTFLVELLPGEYRVRVAAPGYIGEYYEDKASLAAATPIAVEPDAEVGSQQRSISVDLAPKPPLPIFAGLQNPSFESPLDGASNWTTERKVDGATLPAVCDTGLEGVCRVGADTFTDEDSGATNTVEPIDGEHMLRISGPFTTQNQTQSQDKLSVIQRFTVRPDQTKISLNYNAFMYDYTGFDELNIRIRLFDDEGDQIYSRSQGAFAQGTTLKTTGWVGNEIDLADYVGQTVSVRIESAGTEDELYGWWVYVDAGTAPDPGVGSPLVDTSVTPPNGASPVAVSVNKDGSGQIFITVPASAPQLFPDGCLPLPITGVPIAPGAGEASDVVLVLNGQRVALSDDDGDNVWSLTDKLCAESGTLFVQYVLTEGGVSQSFSVPLGGVSLIDPQGVVFDNARYQSKLKELGVAPDCDVAQVSCSSALESARGYGAISGATVTLQRQVGGAFVTVLSGDPGISPNVNPQTTGTTGLYQWDVEPGVYRVKVSAAGYSGFTSAAVDIPPPVLDLHIPLERKRPTGSISASPASPQAGVDTVLRADVTHPDGSQAITGVRWDLDEDGEFDDGDSMTVARVFSAGARTVRAAVSDDDGDVVVLSRTLEVSESPATSTPTPTQPSGTPSDGTAGNPGSPVVKSLANPRIRKAPASVKVRKKALLPLRSVHQQPVKYSVTTKRTCRLVRVGGRPAVLGLKRGTCAVKASVTAKQGVSRAGVLSLRIKVK